MAEEEVAALVVEEEARRKLSVVVEPKEDLEVEALEGEVVRAVDLLDLVSVVVEPEEDSVVEGAEWPIIIAVLCRNIYLTSIFEVRRIRSTQKRPT